MSAPVSALMNSLLFSEKYSDLTIISRNEGFHVHRAVVCAQCPFFEKAIEGPFSESQTNVIILNDDGPEVVSKMITFMYTGNYDDNPRSQDIVTRDRQVAESTTLPTPATSSDTEAVQSTTCEQSSSDGDSSPAVMPSDQGGIINVRVYVLAEKYDLGSLKNLAKGKFEAWAQTHWNDDGFSGVVRAIFGTVPEHDRELHEVAYKIIADKSDHLLVKPDIQHLVQDCGALATAVMLQNREDKIELSRQLEKYKTDFSRQLEIYKAENSNLKGMLLKKEISTSLAERINNLETCYYCHKWFNLVVNVGNGEGVGLSCRNCEEVGY
ncbi:hypothetical protein FQN54_004794 [Arachnomyces sp. PD_36]|nr:hypothetical protein FQN54_004794 [Arachnomyces sp. PD_36]